MDGQMFYIVSLIYVFNFKKAKASVKLRAPTLGVPVSFYNPKLFWLYNLRVQEAAVVYCAMLCLGVTQYF